MHISRQVRSPWSTQSSHACTVLSAQLSAQELQGREDDGMLPSSLACLSPLQEIRTTTTAESWQAFKGCNDDLGCAGVWKMRPHRSCCRKIPWSMPSPARRQPWSVLLSSPQSIS